MTDDVQQQLGGIVDKLWSGVVHEPELIGAYVQISPQGKLSTGKRCFCVCVWGGGGVRKWHPSRSQAIKIGPRWTSTVTGSGYGFDWNWLMRPPHHPFLPSQSPLYLFIYLFSQSVCFMGAIFKVYDTCKLLKTNSKHVNILPHLFPLPLFP